MGRLRYLRNGSKGNTRIASGTAKQMGLVLRDTLNGMRPYLQTRMPTFRLTSNEIGKLIRFFNAMANQPIPYTKRVIKRLSKRELTIARDAFLKSATPCLACHIPGSQEKAPSFARVPDRVKPRWLVRWLWDPQVLMPGTEMPGNLFAIKGHRRILKGKLPPSLEAYKGDHLDLLVRYIMNINKSEERLLIKRNKK